MRATVYRCYDGERLLYVGQTLGDPRHRLSDHFENAEWAKHITHIEIDQYPTWQEAERAEAALIAALAPLANQRTPNVTPLPALSVGDGPEVTSKEALAILGLAQPSSIARYVAAGKLQPSRKLPGSTGAYLFWRSDVERFAQERRRARRGDVAS